MDISKFIECFDDCIYLISCESDRTIIYPDMRTDEGKELFYKIKLLEKKNDNIFFNPYTKQVFEFTEKRMHIDNKDYVVTRLLDITKYKKMENEYILDETTGLYLRKKLLKSLNDYLITAARDEESFSLTMLDIDYFKKINDTYGHQYGDICLNHLSRILHNMVNNNPEKNGILGRFGGEEFIFTINNTDYEYSQYRNEVIRETIQKGMKNVEGIDVNLTCSFGSVFVDKNEIKYTDTSSMPDVRNKIDSIIKEADKNLYESKKTGRNKLTMTRY